MTRRSFMRVLAAVPLVGTLFSACAKSTSASALSAVRILHVTDLHYISPALTDNGACFMKSITQSDGKVMRYSEELAEAFVADVISLAPDCVVFSGDLTFNGAQRSHEDLRDKLARIADAGIPVYVLPGNHDLQNVWAARFEGNSYEKVDSISPSQFSSLYAPFGFEQALARDTDTLSYTVEIAEGLRLLMLDGNVPGKEGVLTQSALNFARAQLKAAEKDGAQIISVTHQPLISHNSLFAASFSMRGTDELLELFQNYSVTCNLCGHMHIQHIATAENGLTEIAGSALSVSPDQFGLLHLQDRSAQYETSVVNVNQWAKKNAIKDENLLDFATYSATFFRDTALWQASNELSNLSEDQADRLANYYADMNAAYFAGRMDQFEWDDTLYEAWQKTGAFEALYMQSIADEARVDHTKAEFTL